MITLSPTTLDALRADAAYMGTSVLIYICCNPCYSHFIDEVIAEGVEINTPCTESDVLPLAIALNNGNLCTARALVAAGANPTGLGRDRRNVIHWAVGYRDTYKRTDAVDVVKYAIKIHPSGINQLDCDGRSPLQTALDMNARKAVFSVLLSSGCSTRMLERVDSGEICAKSHCLPLLIAYGYRFTIDEEREFMYSQDSDFNPLAIMFGTEQCRSVARMILGLVRCGGRVMGNGRDALRLVAKEVWLSRMDEGWLA